MDFKIKKRPRAPTDGRRASERAAVGEEQYLEVTMIKGTSSPRLKKRVYRVSKPAILLLLNPCQIGIRVVFLSQRGGTADVRL